MKLAVNQVGPTHPFAEYQLMAVGSRYDSTPIVEYAFIIIEGYSPLMCVTVHFSHFLTLPVKIRPIAKNPGGPVDPVIARIAKRIRCNTGQVLLK